MSRDKLLVSVSRITKIQVLSTATTLQWDTKTKDPVHNKQILVHKHLIISHLSSHQRLDMFTPLHHMVLHISLHLRTIFHKHQVLHTHLLRSITSRQ